MDNHRAGRVSEALREELGEMIAYELSDPRIGEAVVTEVLVSPDMQACPGAFAHEHRRRYAKRND